MSIGVILDSCTGYTEPTADSVTSTASKLVREEALVWRFGRGFDSTNPYSACVESEFDPADPALNLLELTGLSVVNDFIKE